MSETQKIPLWKFAVTAIALALGVYIALLPPPAGQSFLTGKSMTGLGIFAFFVICSMIDIVPEYICWMLMCTSWAAFKCVTFPQAFGFYTSTTWWLCVGAMVLAAAVAKCGLLRRIALTIMSRFPISYKSQIVSLLAAGTIVSPLIPSGTVKVSLMAPLTVAISDIMGFARRSKGAVGLFNAAFTAVACTIPTLLSATFINYVILGIMEKNNQGVSYIQWAMGSLFWIVLTLVGAYFAIRIIYRVDTPVTKSNNQLKQDLAALGPMSRDEKITLAVLLISLVFWVTERMHGINSTTVILVGVAVLCSSGVLDRKAFRGSVTWDALIFMGCAISMTTAFPAMGIDKWLGDLSMSILVPLISKNIFLFIVVISALIYVIRIFIISQTAFVALFLLFLLPAGNAVGIHPWVMGFITFTAANTWVVRFQNIQYIPALVSADTAAGEVFASHSQNVPFAIYYMVSNIIFLMICVPYWKLIGWM